MEIKISTDELRKKKLFIGTPMYGGQCLGLYMKSCLDLQALTIQYGIDCKFSFIFNESLITRARNYLTDEFLRSGCTHLLFLDADIQFDPKDVLALLALDKDISGGPYPKKSINWKAVMNVAQKNIENKEFNPHTLDSVVGDFVFNPVPGTQSFKISEPVEVMEIGTGFMMIKREVFDVYREKFPELTYKPDHVGQANFDGTRYIHAYFDTVIDPESHRYLSEDYMFCVPSQTIIETDCGNKTIKEIVDSKFSGMVKSMDTKGDIIWNKIIGWSSNRNGKRGRPETKKKWVRLDTYSDNNKKSKLICTSDHRVAVFDDIFNPQLSYVEAENTEEKYVFRKPQRNENRLFSKDQISFLVGTVLGDSSISQSGQLSFTHSMAQSEYANLKMNLFGGKLSESMNRGFGENKPMLVGHFPINEQTRKLRELFYDNGKKTVKNILKFIDEKSLAFWIMDDGSYDYGLNLHTESFSLEDQHLIKDFFKEKWNLVAKIREKFVKYNDEIRKYYYLAFGVEDSKKIAQIVSPYIIDSMKFKIENLFEGNFKFDYASLKCLDFAAAKVKKITQMKNQHRGKLYDIEVDVDHNFFANGTLIHNCQNARKIGYKVWLCPWFKTVHTGSYGFQGNLEAVAHLSGNLR